MRRQEILVDNSLRNRPEPPLSPGLGIENSSLCNLCVLCVSVVIGMCDTTTTKTQRNISGSSVEGFYVGHRETHDEGDRSHYRYSDAQRGGVPTGDHGTHHRSCLRRLALRATRTES